MKILYCVSEVVPFAKTGGLADVAGALPVALAEHGYEIRLALPRYRSTPLTGLRPLGSVEVQVGKDRSVGTVYEGRLPEGNIPVWLFDQPRWFDREGLYGERGREYDDNLARFTFFCHAIVTWVHQQWQPDIIHCNDWQTALIPVIVKTDPRPGFPTLLTIHNLAYQGLFPPDQLEVTGLPRSVFTPAGLEFWGRVNLLKGGLVFADILSTVSQTYAQEIQTEEFGAGLDGVLRDRTQDLFGILNGVDYRTWDPATDTLIPAAYSAENLSGKRNCKAHLQQVFGLAVDPDVPLLGMVTRLAGQKGIDLVAEAITDVLGLGSQFVLLGTGEAAYHALFERIATRFPRQAGVRLGFDNALAHQIEAGADMFLMPSRYEPSGLNQLYSLRYGTVPIVRRTGGLADSIVDLTPETLRRGTANGFVFDEYSPQALFGAIRRALHTFRDEQTWRLLQRTGMRADFSWRASAANYIRLYEAAIRKYARSAASLRG